MPGDFLPCTRHPLSKTLRARHMRSTHVEAFGMGRQTSNTAEAVDFNVCAIRQVFYYTFLSCVLEYASKQTHLRRQRDSNPSGLEPGSTHGNQTHNVAALGHVAAQRTLFKPATFTNQPRKNLLTSPVKRLSL